MEGSKRLVIIDGNSLINRAYYAIQRPMITKEGVYTQGVYGFITMLRKIVSTYEPGYIAVAWDRKAPTFRHEEYAEYKAGRRKMPIELAMQLPIMKDVLAAMNIEMLELDGFEADDIIGAVARRGEEEGLDPFIITGDRDELQLASDRTKVLITKKGISEFELYDADAMMDKYGFTPRQFIDYKGLMGDSSDNIPGLPGVGEKTASKLILEYGSVENLIANVDSVKSAKLRENIKENAQLALMSKRLATIVTDVPIEIDFERMRVRDPDMSSLVSLYLRLEFNSFLNKLGEGASSGQALMVHESCEGADSEEGRPAPVFFDAEISSVIITDADGMNALEAALMASSEAGSPIALKVLGNGDHRDVPEIYGVNVMTEDAHFYVNTEKDASLLPSFFEMFTSVRPDVIGHALQADLYMIFAVMKFLDIKVAIDDSGKTYEPYIFFDSAIAQYLLDPSAGSYSIGRLTLEYFGVQTMDVDEFYKSVAQLDMLADRAGTYAEYGLSYCRAVRSLYAAILPALAEQSLVEVLTEAELPLIVPLAAMEVEGFDFDEGALTDVGDRINKGVERLTEEIYGITG
ncbi:MAG: hypothetical protein LBO70_07440, partial [Clostridiales Family XIII bacterium]|nr:hypothetical protein [Clostridiales Family XIII bacterium]